MHIMSISPLIFSFSQNNYSSKSCLCGAFVPQMFVFVGLLPLLIPQGPNIESHTIIIFILYSWFYWKADHESHVVHDCVICVFLFLSICCSLPWSTLLFSFRHKTNNYFLNAYRHIWLEKMHERADYDSLLSMLTVMWCLGNVYWLFL